MTTQYEFLTLQAGSSALHGLKTGHAPRCVIHIHGTWGNFYENPFALQLSDTYVNAGWSYATVNNQGHDGGSITEEFGASLPEIAAWANRLAPNQEPLILQGHSLGALKILRMLQVGEYSELTRRLTAAVLLSPFDLVAFNGGVGEDLKRNRDEAKLLRRENGGTSLVGTDMFSWWPLSIDTYLEATNEGSAWDLFPTRENNIGALGALNIPVMVAIGGKDFASYPDARQAAELVSQQAPPNVHLAFIEDAPHNFAGHEDALGHHIRDFIASL
jgi:alpha-beta hydrolase superfamily lysophospholipase